jgi:hypothetical protein
VQRRRLELPSVKSSEHTPDRVFDLGSPVQDIIDSQSDAKPSIINFGDRTLDATPVDRAILHAIYYVGCKSRPDSTYPKCIACGLPDHTIYKCHPLINHRVAQVLAAQHPEIVKQIIATCNFFPHSARERPSRPTTVTLDCRVGPGKGGDIF